MARQFHDKVVFHGHRPRSGLLDQIIQNPVLKPRAGPRPESEGRGPNIFAAGHVNGFPAPGLIGCAPMADRVETIWSLMA